MPADEIKKLLKTDKLIMGKEETIKALKTGSVTKVFLAENCDASIKDDVDYYAGLANVTVEQLEMKNDELGDYCKKPFSISVIGFRK